MSNLSTSNFAEQLRSAFLLWTSWSDCYHWSPPSVSEPFAFKVKQNQVSSIPFPRGGWQSLTRVDQGRISKGRVTQGQIRVTNIRPEGREWREDGRGGNEGEEERRGNWEKRGRMTVSIWILARWSRWTVKTNYLYPWDTNKKTGRRSHIFTCPTNTGAAASVSAAPPTAARRNNGSCLKLPQEAVAQFRDLLRLTRVSRLKTWFLCHEEVVVVVRFALEFLSEIL